MHPTLPLGAFAALAGIGMYFAAAGGPAPERTPQGPEAAGHYAFVVQGDRSQLTITHAVAKPDPWAGVPKGFSSEWSLSIRDARGGELARVPLDLTKFDLQPERQGKPVVVEGCIVRDSKVAMLANAPAYPTAASYVFLRGELQVGTVAAATVQQLAGGGR
jgi:hypothetical protein